jgi:hypothetical protein
MEVVFMFSEEGTWSFSDRKNSLTLHHKASPTDPMGASSGPKEEGEQTWEIRRLEREELWLRQQQANGDVWEVHFKPYRCCK